MKPALQQITIHTFSLYATSLLYDGIVISGGLISMVIGGFLLTIGFKILKPILTIITLPFHMLSFGLFSALTITFTLYLISLVYSNIKIESFDFPGFVFLGFEIHSFYASIFLSYLIISVTIYLIGVTLTKLFKN